VTANVRARRLAQGVEAALAFAAGAGVFALVGVTVAVVDSDLVVAAVGVACAVALVAVVRRWGVVYGLPVGIAALIAFDWYQFPPTHPLAFPSADDIGDLCLYLGVSVTVGEVAATALRRSSDEVARLAQEQASLRRVATLVARHAAPDAVFSVVTEEVGKVLGVDAAAMIRYEGEGIVAVISTWGRTDAPAAVGSRLAVGGRNVSSLVFETGRSARMDDYTDATGALARSAQAIGLRSAIGTPIVVDGSLWGAMVAFAREPGCLAPDAEARIGEFTDLVATAIANVQAQLDLAASRARIVAAADAERRRVVRDLHDGAQQRLVHTVLTLKLAQQARGRGEDPDALVAEALEQAQRATSELRELSHGIMPSVLTRGGLQSAVEALAARTPLPVQFDVGVGRLPPVVEATAYFVVAEALTNVAKHAHARSAEVVARLDAGTLRVDVRDDGVGGARLDGSGLTGLADRLAALDGRLRVESAPGAGTLVEAAIPVGAAAES
jgi:signal transduction histidine kinase